MPSGSHVEAARLGPGLCGRACESKSDARRHPCCASRGRSTTLRGLSDAPLKSAASALDRFEKRPTLRAPFLSHGQPVRRRRVGRAREDQSANFSRDAAQELRPTRFVSRTSHGRNDSATPPGDSGTPSRTARPSSATCRSSCSRRCSGKRKVASKTEKLCSIGLARRDNIPL